MRVPDEPAADGNPLVAVSVNPQLGLPSVISAFLTDYLHEQRGMTVQGATTIMFIFGLGCFAGNLLGGVLGQWVYNRRKEWAAFLMALSTILGFLPMYWLINTPTVICTPDGGFTLLAGTVALLGGIAAFTGPLVRAFVMQVNSSRNRGTVFSVFMVADDLGKGLGPAAVSLLIPSFGRQLAFNISLSGWGLCAIFLFLMGFTIRADEEALERELREAAAARKEKAAQNGTFRRLNTSSRRETPPPHVNSETYVPSLGRMDLTLHLSESHGG